MIRVRSLMLFVLITSTFACQTTDVFTAYLSPPPTATRTRSPTRPVASPSPQQPVRPTPPPPPSPTTPVELTGTVTENSRVRAAPSTSAAIITRLNKGERIKVVGRNDSS